MFKQEGVNVPLSRFVRSVTVVQRRKNESALPHRDKHNIRLNKVQSAKEIQMKRFLLVPCLITVLAGLGQAQYHDAYGTTPRKASQASPATLQIIKNTYIVNGFSGASIPVEVSTPVDSSSTVTCPGTKNCLIQADQWVQFYGNGTSGNATGICLSVDGAWINNACYWAGELNTGVNASQLSTSQGYTVTPGKHTVQTQVFSLYGGSLGIYSLTYRVYVP
jgi:hypothetical protein